MTPSPAAGAAQSQTPNPKPQSICGAEQAQARPQRPAVPHAATSWALPSTFLTLPALGQRDTGGHGGHGGRGG